MHYYLEALKKYAVFSGRAQRAEYWYFVLFDIIIGVALMIADAAFGTFRAAVGGGLLSGIYALATLIPRIAVAVRRLHDTDHNGWWVFIIAIPIIGFIILLFFLARDGHIGENRYGQNPKEIVS